VRNGGVLFNGQGREEDAPFEGNRQAQLRRTNRTWEVTREGDEFIFPDGTRVSRDVIERIARDEGSVYFVRDGRVYKAAIAGEHYYKLVPTIPTIEINGIRMHRTKGVNPLQDTRSKVNAVKPGEGETVLDTCMGLGYTAIEASKRGAYVITIEKDKNVIELAKINPWSRELFTGQNPGDSRRRVRGREKV